MGIRFVTGFVNGVGLSMGTHELAIILQGEAAVLGMPGMFAVGLCVMARLSLGQRTDNFYGRATPSSEALFLSSLFLSVPPNVWTDNFGLYPYCLSKQDVSKLRAPPGDKVVGNGKYQIHLFKEWPRERVEQKTSRFHRIESQKYYWRMAR